MEAQNDNLRQMTAPERTDAAGNEHLSSGYATPEEELAPMTPRSAPPTPPTNFRVTHMARDISPGRIQIRIEEEEQRQEDPHKEHQDDQLETRLDGWTLSHQHSHRWPYRLLPERKDPKPTDGVQRQRETLQHLMMPPEQLQIA